MMSIAQLADDILYGATPTRGLGIAGQADGATLYAYPGEEDYITEYRDRGGELRKIVVQGGHKLIIADFKINQDLDHDITLHLSKGLLHREDDKPAVETSDGCYWWFRHGAKHREPAADGASRPAVIDNYGQEYWYNGQLHRHDGKAKVDAWGESVWAWLGKQYKRRDLWSEAKRLHPVP